VPSLPRGRRCPHGRLISPAAACRIATASPYHPGPQPAPGRISDEASARVHCHSPHTSLPLACDPGRNGVLGLFPELCTQPGRTRQRTSGRGQAWTLPGLRPWHQPASFDVLTHNVRPHVAKKWLICARTPRRTAQPSAAQIRRTVREARYAPCYIACSLPDIRHRRGLAAAIVTAPRPFRDWLGRAGRRR
jgi:hypothetical protein